MNKQQIIDIYTNEILKASGDKEKISLVLRLAIENTERECSSKAAALAYDNAHKVSRITAWDDAEVSA